MHGTLKLSCLTLLFTFDALLLWFDIEYLLEAFEEEGKQGDDRVLDIDVSVALVVQFLLSLFAVGVGDDVEYLSKITMNMCHKCRVFICLSMLTYRLRTDELLILVFLSAPLRSNGLTWLNLLLSLLLSV